MHPFLQGYIGLLKEAAAPRTFVINGQSYTKDELRSLFPGGNADIGQGKWVINRRGESEFVPSGPLSDKATKITEETARRVATENTRRDAETLEANRIALEQARLRRSGLVSVANTRNTRNSNYAAAALYNAEKGRPISVEDDKILRQLAASGNTRAEAIVAKRNEGYAAYNARALEARTEAENPRVRLANGQTVAVRRNPQAGNELVAIEDVGDVKAGTVFSNGKTYPTMAAYNNAQAASQARIDQATAELPARKQLLAKFIEDDARRLGGVPAQARLNELGEQAKRAKVTAGDTALASTSPDRYTPGTAANAKMLAEQRAKLTALKNS